MSINKVGLRLARKQTNDVKQLKRFVRELKTPQSIGADIISVDRIPTGGYAEGGPFTIAAGGASTITFTTTPSSDILTLWNFLDSVYVDSDAETNRFSGGSSLTSGQRNMIKTPWWDWSLSNDSTNSRVYALRIYNNDSASHDYYIKLRAYMPHNPGAALS